MKYRILELLIILAWFIATLIDGLNGDKVIYSQLGMLLVIVLLLIYKKLRR